MNARKRIWPAILIATTGLGLVAGAAVAVDSRSTSDPVVEVQSVPVPVTVDWSTGWSADPFGGGPIPMDYLTGSPHGGTTMADPIGGGKAIPKGYGTSGG